VRRALVRSALAGFALAACSSGAGTGTTGTGAGGSGGGCAGGPTAGDLPCDVSMVLHDKCQMCHQMPPQGGAHFPLITYEDTQQPLGSQRRWRRMAEVIEPGAVPHMPYKTAPQLTDAEHATLKAWFAACAPPQPEGKGCDNGG
jgi:uncharacterized membrane protein